MTTFRVPETVHRQIKDIISRTITSDHHIGAATPYSSFVTTAAAAVTAVETSTPGAHRPALPPKYATAKVKAAAAMAMLARERKAMARLERTAGDVLLPASQTLETHTCRSHPRCVGEPVGDPNFALAPHRSYTAPTLVLHRSYTGPTPLLHRSYTGSTPVLHRFYTGPTLHLHRSQPATVCLVSDSGFRLTFHPPSRAS
jgi:hypothetical protein